MKNKKTKGNLTNNQTAPVLQRSHHHILNSYKKQTWIFFIAGLQIR